MKVEIELPDMGEDAVDEGTVAEWFVEEGDRIEKGEILMEVVSDETAFEVPSPESGVIVERLVQEEDLVQVGDVLAIVEVTEIEGEGEEELTEE